MTRSMEGMMGWLIVLSTATSADGYALGLQQLGRAFSMTGPKRLCSCSGAAVPAVKPAGATGLPRRHFLSLGGQQRDPQCKKLQHMIGNRCVYIYMLQSRSSPPGHGLISLLLKGKLQDATSLYACTLLCTLSSHRNWSWFAPLPRLWTCGGCGWA